MRLFWWFSTNVQAWDIFKLASPWVVHQITQLQYSKTTWNMLPFPAASNRSNVSAVKPKPAKIIRENLIRILTAWTRIERHATKFFTVFESRQKSRIQYCERSELRLHFEWTKVNSKCQKWWLFENLKLVVKQCYQTVHYQKDKNWWKMPKMVNLESV